MKEDSNKDFSLNRELLLQMLSNIPDAALFLINSDEKVIFGEGSELRQLVDNTSDLTDKPYQEVFDNHLSETLFPLIKLAFEGHTGSHEMRNNSIYYYIQVIPITQGTNRTEYFMVLFENITEDKKHDEEIRNARISAEKASVAKSEFLAKVSHEIRTPLNSIVGFSEQLSKTKLNKEQAKFLDSIRIASKHLLSVINKTISLSQVESGKKRLENKVFFISEVIEDIIEIEYLKAELQNLELNYAVSNRLNFPITGDVVSLKEILLNLLNNAIKFTENGSVTLTSEIEKKTKSNVYVKFRIIDTGKGIPQNKLNIIFDEFKQAGPDIKRKYKGSGLGLSITKKLTNLLNGSIKVESKLNKGTEFTVIIPFLIKPDSDNETSKTTRIDTSLLKGKSFLLVDDDEMNRNLADIIFRNWKIKIDLTSNGHDALKKVKSKKYDMILLDIHMPGMDGIETAQHIRKTYYQTNHMCYILAVTANVVEKDLKRYLASGIDGYLLKPFTEKEMFDTIVRFLFSHATSDTDISKFTPRETEKEKKAGTDYDLADLIAATGSNHDFFNKMINTFISNTNSSLHSVKVFLDNEKWDELGETAHRMIPSYRHLRINKLANLLEDIEELALEKKDYDPIAEKVTILNLESIAIMNKLKKEIK